MVTIPEAVWNAMIEVLIAERPGVERVAYLDGIGERGAGIITTVVVPNADLHPQWYEVSPDAMSEAARHLRLYGLVRLAQVHTHPSADCRHSSYDDEHAYSQRAGAISIVLPYRASRRPHLDGALVHLRTDLEWTHLSRDATQQYVRCSPGLIDLRRN